jgi:hypothetical protein
MLWFSFQRVRWVAVFCTLILLSSLLPSCATAPSSQKYVGSLFDPRKLSRTNESFPDLWEKWTVHLGMPTRGGKPWQLSSSFTSGGGAGGPGGEFPLRIIATLMDTMLIEAGLHHYETRLAMTQQEREEFRRTYFQRYDVENHLLIWCELSTTWTELFLDLDRWIIFIEDDALNQYEPEKIFEKPQPAGQTVMDTFPEFETKRGNPGWETHQKSLMFCFPKRDFYQNPVLSPKLKFLKLVFQLNDDEKTRAEGIWAFKK